jgi:hypothetical protein
MENLETYRLRRLRNSTTKLCEAWSDMTRTANALRAGFCKTSERERGKNTGATLFLVHFLYIKMIVLPRQAWGKRRATSKRAAFSLRGEQKEKIWLLNFPTPAEEAQLKRMQAARRESLLAAGARRSTLVPKYLGLTWNQGTRSEYLLRSIAKPVSGHAGIQIFGRFPSNLAVFAPQRRETRRPMPI